MELHELPMLQQVFTELRKGRHICMEDGGLFDALSGNLDRYQSLFSAMGLNLVFHGRGFFYLDDESAPKSAQRIVLFTAILVETLDDSGVNLDMELTTIPIHPSNLPHLKHEKYQKVMAEADVRSEEDLFKVLDAMKRYGLAEPDKNGIWHFRTSAYRLLDILNMAGRYIQDAPVSGASVAPSQAPTQATIQTIEMEMGITESEVH